MRKRWLIDTNLIIRYLVQDHEKHARTAVRLFDDCDRGEVVIVVLSARSSGVRFVLESFYEHPGTDIASALSRLISSPGVEVIGAEVHLDALNRYERTRAHFVDCLIAASAVSEKLSVATFDQDFRMFSDISVEL